MESQNVSNSSAPSGSREEKSPLIHESILIILSQDILDTGKNERQDLSLVCGILRQNL